MTPPEHTCSYQNPLNMHQNTKPKQNSRGFFAYSFHPTSLSGHLVFRGQGWNLPFTKTEQGVSWRHRLLFLTTKQDLPINKMSEQTHRTFIGSCKFTLGRQAEPNLAGWMCDHERLYFKGHSAWKSEDKNRGGERAQSHPAGKDYTSWAEAAWLQQGAWPDQGKLGLEARALGSRGWGGSPLLQGCPASTEGWDEPDTPPPSGGGVAVVEEAQGHSQSSPRSKGEHLAVQGSAEGHRDYSLLPNLILRTYDPINCGETNTGEETWEPDAWNVGSSAEVTSSRGSPTGRLQRTVPRLKGTDLVPSPPMDGSLSALEKLTGATPSRWKRLSPIWEK